MRKIPTLFVRDPYDLEHVTEEIAPGCEWVMNGDGIATRQYDGVCVKIDKSGYVWARRKVKPGRQKPRDFRLIEINHVTGMQTGWEPAAQSPINSWLHEAYVFSSPMAYPEGVYELCGPEINGNPEGYDHHRLIMHDKAERFVDLDIPFSVNWVRKCIMSLPWEGVVWHNPDGRKAKIKKTDFR